MEAPRDEEAVLVADLDLDQRRDWLELFPFLLTRRPDSYAALTAPSMPTGLTAPATPRRQWSNDLAVNRFRRRVARMTATLFTGGVIWTGSAGDTDALLVVDGVVRAVGEQARAPAAGADEVDLAGAFLMPSFGDGHAHPLYGGLEPRGHRCGRATPSTKSSPP